MEYIDLGLPSGLLWADRNLGADNEEAAGLYYAWGETTGYADAAARNTALGRSDYFSSNAYTATGASAISANLTLAQDAAQAYMGADWRMPTNAEFEELIAGCNFLWFYKNRVWGGLFTSKTNGNSIFLPQTGLYSSTNATLNNSDIGFYWSSTYFDSDRACYLTLDSTKPGMWRYFRYVGIPIRAVKDSGLKPEPEPEDLTDEELSYSSNSAIVLGDLNDAIPTLTNTHNLELTFESSDTDVATVNSSGIVQIVGNGTTTISATFAGNEEYNEKTISYVLTVNVKKYLDYEGLKLFKLKLYKVIEDNEKIISAALNVLNNQTIKLNNTIEENEEVTSTALNDLNIELSDKANKSEDLDGIKIKKITQSAYDALVQEESIDLNTLYFIYLE